MTDTTHETSEPSESFWPGDVFGRHDDAAFLHTFLKARIEERGQRGRKRSFVLNIDGDWGRGKSFFLAGLADYLRAAGHPVAQVDAWRDDFAIDPLVPFMAAVEDASKEFLDKVEGPKIIAAVKENGVQLVAALGKGVANTLVKRVVGETIDELAGALFDKKDPTKGIAAEAAKSGVDEMGAKLQTLLQAEAVREVDSFRSARATVDEFGKSIEKLVRHAEKQGKVAPFFVLVDELDRCRPSYAVALLERVKHLFSVDGVVFIFGTNMNELSHAVTAIYGHSFDGRRYLHRFFDRTYRLPTPTVLDFVTTLTNELPHKSKLETTGDFTAYLAYLFESFDMDLRSIEQCLDLLGSILTVWGSPEPLIAPILMPMIVGDKLGLKPEFSIEFSRQLAEREIKKVPPVMVFEDYSNSRHRELALTFTQAFDGFYLAKSFNLKSLREGEVSSNYATRWYSHVLDADTRGLQKEFSANRYAKVIATAGRLHAEGD